MFDIYKNSGTFPEWLAGQELIGVVDSVIDGDTCEIQVTGLPKSVTLAFTLRIIGIDAPESDQPGGPAATRALKKLVAGKKVLVTPTSQDVYGRIIGSLEYCHYRLTTEDQDIGKIMVESGNAWALISKYCSAQARAKQGRKGIWKAKRPPVMPGIWRTKA